MRSERASPQRPRLRSLTAMGPLAALLLGLACGGEAELDNGRRVVAGSSGVEESSVAGAAGQGQAIGESGGGGDPGAGASGGGGTSGDAGSVAGTGGRSICASATVESRAPRYAYEFVVEASESMNQPALGSTLTRWQVVKDALAGFAQWVPPTVALGLVTIPADGQCSTAGVQIPLAPTTPEHAQSLLDALDAIEPAGGEPAHEAVAVAIDDLVAGASLIDAEANLVVVLDDVPTPTAQCDWSIDASDALISELKDAVDSRAIRHLVIVGMPDSEQARQSLTSLSGEVHQGLLRDCGLSMPQPCDGWVASGPVTLEDGLKSLLIDINPPELSCTIDVPELRDNPSVDLSQLTLRVTEDGENTQILTLARGQIQDCRDGWVLEDRGDAVILCPSLCEDFLHNIQQVDFTWEFQFSCL